jgi:hypothetical protein
VYGADVVRAAGKGSRLGMAVGIALKALAVAAMVATPLLGVWVASSLAALRHGPVWLTLLAGLLLFPLLPVAWELWSAWRRARRASLTRRVLSLSDRLILRTLALNAIFLGALLASQPSAAFTALSARGDWMLDGRHDPSAAATRTQLFALAAKLEWLYLAAHKNPFRKPTPSPSTSSLPSPNPSPAATGTSPRPNRSPSPNPRTNPNPSPNPNPDPISPAWPAPAELDPILAEMPDWAESTIQSLAGYVSQRVPAPLARLKALHDWVADRVAYDADSYLAGRYPPQDAQTVFKTHLSVCAGYANLLEALSRAAGLEVLYIPGDARTQGNDLSGQGHAWNAARIDGKWYLLDATWDSGFLQGSHFEKRYSTEYFLTPPRIFNVDHLPDDSRWQLLDKPLTRGEFLRQPALSPLFFANGLELLAPDRSQVDVQSSLDVSLKNPQGVFLLASYETRGNRAGRQPCHVDDGATPHVTCRFPTPGSYDVKLFTNRQSTGTFNFAGQLQANSN